MAFEPKYEVGQTVRCRYNHMLGRILEVVVKHPNPYLSPFLKYKCLFEDGSISEQHWEHIDVVKFSKEHTKQIVRAA